MGKNLIHKSAQDSNYTKVPNEILYDDSIGHSAKYLLIYLISLPNNWKIVKGNLPKMTGMKYSQIVSAFKELVAAGYIVEERVQNAKTGKFTDWKYEVFSSPELQNNGNADSANHRLEEIPISVKTDCRQNGVYIKETEYRQRNRNTRKDTGRNTNTDTHTQPTANFQFKAPEEEEVKAYFQEYGHDPKEALLYYDKCTAIGWKDKHGNQIVNWKAYARSSWFPNIGKNVRSNQRNGDFRVIKGDAKNAPPVKFAGNPFTM